MPAKIENPLCPLLKDFAAELTSKFAQPSGFQPEDQLKAPVETLIEGAGRLLGLKVQTLTEVRVGGLGGRPDMGETVDGLLVGHIELKAPGKGADPGRFKERDQEQWNRFKDLPNLLYTDGNEWALYRTGHRQGDLVRLAGDVTKKGRVAVSDADAEALFRLLRDWFLWQPVVPARPRDLAAMVAPLCRLLRTDVESALKRPDSALAHLAEDWRKYLLPDADDLTFADAYAQTLTYALLLARVTASEKHLTVDDAAKTLRTGHRLLADTLEILGDPDACREVEAPVSMLLRVIDAVDPDVLAKHSEGDVWLYFYEDFLAAYDPQMRKERGVYYTPVPVVQAQVRLVAQLLAEHFDAEFSFADPNVITLDPAGGTGTYILGALQHSLAQVGEAQGPGMRKARATTAARNLYLFELLVGPYAVAHLRLTQQVKAEEATVPEDGVHVYLTDTLESPHAPQPQFPWTYRELGLEHQRAQKVKAEVPILVCMGNPPYSRQTIELDQQESVKRRGGWVRYGDPGDGGIGILDDFVGPLTPLGLGLHAKNLYNDYVYFWRWALWKVFEHKQGPGIVSFITASSYLRGPGFAGMRQLMRQTFDELWIIDLEGDNLGARKTENVFAIRTPVAIALGVRYGTPQPETPATVRYTRIEGTEQEKLGLLAAVEAFGDLQWRTCLPGWTDPFLPTSDKPYWDWPLLTDLFPWQENGVQFKRTWPIGETPALLERRWTTLVSAPEAKKAGMLRETEARKISKKCSAIDGVRVLPALMDLSGKVQPEGLTRYAFRSFDRQWSLLDVRLCDRPRPSLLLAHSDRQVYMASLLTNVLGDGPAAVATALIPDLDHFRGSFGAKHVIPLWRDAAASQANVTAGLPEALAAAYAQPVAAEDLFAYCYAVLATPDYVRRFWEELTLPGPRIPLTRDSALFARAVALGRRLLWLHTYGQRFVPPGKGSGKVPSGLARCRVGTPEAPEEYPERFAYDASSQELHVGKGVFSGVRSEVWEFSVSGLHVVRSWLGYRMRERSGKKSSPLDDIRPEKWTFDEELLELLWILDATVDLLPEASRLLEEILSGDLFRAAELPAPAESQRRALAQELPLFREPEPQDVPEE